MARIAWLLVCALLWLPAGPARAMEDVDVALVLLSDVSRSVNDPEYKLQKEGYVAAFTSQPVINAIRGGALGVIALLGLLALRHGKAVPAWFAGFMVIVSLTVSALMAWTANIGGQIRHTEIRVGAAPSTSISKDRD